MIELFPQISDKMRREAEGVWNLSQALSPEKAASFLLNYTQMHNEEEQEFLQFYFNLQMEVLKQ